MPKMECEDAKGTYSKIDLEIAKLATQIYCALLKDGEEFNVEERITECAVDAIDILNASRTGARVYKMYCEDREISEY